jgi:hypothetical protein
MGIDCAVQPEVHGFFEVFPCILCQGQIATHTNCDIIMRNLEQGDSQTHFNKLMQKKSGLENMPNTHVIQ